MEPQFKRLKTLAKNCFMTLAVILLTISLTAGYMVNSTTKKSSTKEVPAVVTISDDDYQKLGLSRSQVEPWEDGIRTTGGKGSYEWWYFDSTF